MSHEVPYKPLRSSQKLVALAFVVCGFWYLSWRLTSFNHDAMTFSVLIYFAEVFGFLTALLHLFMNWRLTIREAPEAPSDLSVDIFIPTINESVSIVRRTILAAQHVDYPHQTWVLDDGHRPEIAQLTEELGCKYLSRDSNVGAKAGNLNYALAHSTGEFVAIFDADHAPQRKFLHKTLGYFCDPEVAFVQTPQDFYNLDSYQHRWKPGDKHVWTEQSLFFRVIQRGKDYWNSAFLCGSCVVIRRSALEKIDGFATETVTEDLHTSIRLHMQGFRSIYHAESLAFGLAPDKATAFLSQRIRWGQGAMQVLRMEGTLLNTRLTLAQRLNYFASIMTYFDGWQKAIFYAAPLIALLTGVMPVHALGGDFLNHFIPYLLLTFWVFEEVGRGYGRSIKIEQYNMARFAAFARATLALFKDNIRFNVTDKSGADPSSEDHQMISQKIVLAASVFAIPVGIGMTFNYDWLPTGGMLANVTWAAINASLAFAVVFFTTNRAHRRVEYRFPVSIPVSVDTSSGTVYGTADNISSNGLKLYARLPDDIQLGGVVNGELLLPSGAIRFQSVVSRIIKDQADNHIFVKALGCEFHWQNAIEHDALEIFLYASDLQWQLHSLQESVKTPIEYFAQMFAPRAQAPTLAPENWAPIVYSQVSETLNQKSTVGLVSSSVSPENSRYALLFERLPDNTEIRGTIMTRSKPCTISASLEFQRNMESPVAPIYMYLITVKSSDLNPVS